VVSQKGRAEAKTVGGSKTSEDKVPGEEDAADLQAGAAKVDITPPTGFPLWGHPGRRDAPCVGIRDPLFAKALVLAVGSNRIAIVGLDLGRAPTRGSTAAIRLRVKAATGINHIFLVASHTHCGPYLEMDNWPSPETSYVRQLEQKVADVIIEADNAARPARLGIASGEVDLNRNRQSKRAKKVRDRELLVLRVESMDGKLIAHAVNFAAHPALLGPKVMEFSADYPGAMAEVVEQETGALCLFLQGAAGDMSPSLHSDSSPGHKQFGRALGREVLELVQTIKCTELPSPTLRAQEESFQFECRLKLSDPAVSAKLTRQLFAEPIAFLEREYRDGVRPHLTTALLDGRIGFVGVSGEFFCGHALSLRKRAKLPHLFFFGYCNDHHMYFPTIEATAEGGYGTQLPISAASPGAGEKIMDQALTHLSQMQRQAAETPREE
jgi:hypothetical protein